MRKQGLAVIFVLVLAFMLSVGCGVSFAQETEGGRGADGNNERMGPPPGGENRPQPPENSEGGRDGKMRPQKPPMPEIMYIGYAVKAENEFEMASVNIFPPRGAQDGGEGDSKLKKPAGVIEIAKKKYFIVEAKIETQEATLQLFPKEAKERGMKPPSVIKTLSAKISSTYFEMPQEPPAPGQADKMKMPEGTANIVGDINISAVEKEAGDRQLIMVSGSVNTGEEKFSLYLEPRIIHPQPMRDGMQQRGGGPGQGPGQGGMERRGGKRPRPGSENGGGGDSRQNRQGE